MEKLNIKNIGLFPETPPTVLTHNHFRFLDKLAARREILQKDLIKSLDIDKTTISEIKSDFTRLGWCKDVDLGSGKEIKIELCKVNEIKSFLGQWQSTKHQVYVRPHSIKCRVISDPLSEGFEKAINKLTEKYRVIVSGMQNNKQYSVKTDYGTIILHLNGKIIDFWVEGFVIPIKKEDLDYFEDYIIRGIESKVLEMHSIIKEHFHKSKVKVGDCIYLKSLHIGIITKKNVSKIISLQNKINDLEMFCDDSIYNCDEIEAKGKLDSVLKKVKTMLGEFFEN